MFSDVLLLPWSFCEESSLDLYISYIYELTWVFPFKWSVFSKKDREASISTFPADTVIVSLSQF